MSGKWRRSSRSTAAGNNCVETRLSNGVPQVRDSKLGDASPILSMSSTDFAALLVSVR